MRAQQLGIRARWGHLEVRGQRRISSHSLGEENFLEKQEGYASEVCGPGFSVKLGKLAVGALPASWQAMASG